MKNLLRVALVLSFVFCTGTVFAATAEQPAGVAAAAPEKTAPPVEPAAPAESGPLAKTVFDQEQKKNVDACCFAACAEAWGACKRACNLDPACLDQCWTDWQYCKTVC